MINFIFRLDANFNVGVGHLARCCYVAEDILSRELGKVYFCTSEKIFLPPFLNTKEIEFVPVGHQEDGLINFLNSLSGKKVIFYDSFDLDRKIEELVSPFVDSTVVIDDLANREHQCDILIDCGYQRELHDYQSLVPKETKLLIGLDYCFISENIKRIKKDFIQEKKRIHLFFGGGVKNSQVIDFFSHLKDSFQEYSFNIAFSTSLSPEDQVSIDKVSRTGDVLYIGEPLYSSLSGCSIAIGSPGISTWERCFLEIPSFYISTNSNQIDILLSLEKLNICRYLGTMEDDRGKVITRFKECFSDHEVGFIREKLNGLVDGEGTRRVVDEVLKLL